jgi:hypothetical protein
VAFISNASSLSLAEDPKDEDEAWLMMTPEGRASLPLRGGECAFFTALFKVCAPQSTHEGGTG